MSDLIWATAFFFLPAMCFVERSNKAMKMMVRYCKEEYISIFLSSCIMGKRDSCSLPYYKDTAAY